MPTIIEVPIDLGAADITSSGCVDPENAVDGDETTVADFGPPDVAEDPWVPVVNANPQPGQARSAYFAVTPAALAPRFLKAEWQDDRFVTKIRIKATGDGLENAGISLLMSLGFIEQGEMGEPPELPLLLPPFPDSDGFYTVVFDPPFYAMGVVVHPDALFSAAELAQLTYGNYPTLLLSQLDVFETVEEGTEPMSQPTETRVRVGVQELKLFPWNGATGPYDNTTACYLYGLEGVDITTNSKSAVIKGGETVHQLGAHETDREEKLKVTANTTDLNALKILLGGSFAVDPAAGGLGEVQYRAADYGDRAPYFRMWGKSTNGDGTDTYWWAKLKVDGSVGFNLNKDKEAVLTFDAMVFWDKAFVRRDGNTGGTGDHIFGAKGEVARHS